jgi:hypothetical protein
VVVAELHLSMGTWDGSTLRLGDTAFQHAAFPGRFRFFYGVLQGLRGPARCSTTPHGHSASGGLLRRIDRCLGETEPPF